MTTWISGMGDTGGLRGQRLTEARFSCRRADESFPLSGSLREGWNQIPINDIARRRAFVYSSVLMKIQSPRDLATLRASLPSPDILSIASGLLVDIAEISPYSSPVLYVWRKGESDFTKGVIDESFCSRDTMKKLEQSYCLGHELLESSEFYRREFDRRKAISFIADSVVTDPEVLGMSVAILFSALIKERGDETTKAQFCGEILSDLVDKLKHKFGDMNNFDNLEKFALFVEKAVSWMSKKFRDDFYVKDDTSWVVDDRGFRSLQSSVLAKFIELQIKDEDIRNEERFMKSKPKVDQIAYLVRKATRHIDKGVLREVFGVKRDDEIEGTLFTGITRVINRVCVSRD